MRTIAIAGQKGGVGKTTTAVNIAAGLAAFGRKVLVIDADGQASASHWLGCRDGGKALLEVLQGERTLEDAVVKTPIEGVELVPASAWLAGAERQLTSEPGAETLLRSSIAALQSPRWHYCLIDCPPALGLLSVIALTAADGVLVPCEVRPMALDGVVALQATIAKVRQRLNPGLSLVGILPCRVDLRTRLSGDVVEMLRAKFKGDVLETVIRENIKLAEAPGFAKSIFAYAPGSSGAEDYTAATSEFRARVRRIRSQ